MTPCWQPDLLPAWRQPRVARGLPGRS